MGSWHEHYLGISSQEKSQEKNDIITKLLECVGIVCIGPECILEEAGVFIEGADKWFDISGSILDVIDVSSIDVESIDDVDYGNIDFDNIDFDNIDPEEYPLKVVVHGDDFLDELFFIINKYIGKTELIYIFADGTTITDYSTRVEIDLDPSKRKNRIHASSCEQYSELKKYRTKPD